MDNATAATIYEQIGVKPRITDLSIEIDIP